MTRVLKLLLLAMAVSSAGCDKPGVPAEETSPLVDPAGSAADSVAALILQHVDVAWYRDRLREQVDASHAAVRADGFVYRAYTRNWQPVTDAPGRLVIHVRTIYSLVRGFEYFGDDKYLDAAVRAGRYLLENYSAGPGHWLQEVTPGGSPHNRSRYDLGYAHTIDALAHLYLATQNREFLDAARETWSALPVWAEITDLEALPGGLPIRRLNSFMHLFEATLTLARADQESIAGLHAQLMVDYSSKNLLHDCGKGRCFPEHWSGEWKPHANEQNFVDLGHNLEWVRMVRESELVLLDRQQAQEIDQLFEHALDAGYDNDHGGSFFRASLSSVHNGEKLWWGQFELLHTLLYLAARQEKSDLWQKYDASFQYLQREFWDQDNNGFFFSAQRGEPDRIQPGGVYHLVNLALSAIRLHEDAEKRAQ